MINRILNQAADMALPVLKRLDAELAHDVTLRALSLGLGPRGPQPDPDMGYEIFGKWVPSRIGVPAGMDKNCAAPQAWFKMGYGVYEAGGICVPPRTGNAKPRLFRLGGNALANNFGLNTLGIDVLFERIAAFREEHPSACLGASLVTPDNDESELALMTRRLRPYVDYFGCSPFCPNLNHVLSPAEAHERYGRHLAVIKYAAGGTPVLLKHGPETDLKQLVDDSGDYLGKGADGFICCNTIAPGRKEILDPASRPRPWPRSEGKEIGGYSGPAGYAISSAMIRALRKAFPQTVLIGVNGVGQPHKAVEMLQAGANLVQMYAGVVYQGPQLVWESNRAIAAAGLLQRRAA